MSWKKESSAPSLNSLYFQGKPLKNRFWEFQTSFSITTSLLLIQITSNIDQNVPINILQIFGFVVFVVQSLFLLEKSALLFFTDTKTEILAHHAHTVAY